MVVVGVVVVVLVVVVVVVTLDGGHLLSIGNKVDLDQLSILTF